MSNGYFGPKDWYNNFCTDLSEDDLRALGRAIEEERIVEPFNCGRNPHNGKLILRHCGSKERLILLDAMREEELIDILRDEFYVRFMVENS